MNKRCPECNRPLAVRVDECKTHQKTNALWLGLRNASRTAERKLDESGFTARERVENGDFEGYGDYDIHHGKD